MVISTKVHGNYHELVAANNDMVANYPETPFNYVHGKFMVTYHELPMNFFRETPNNSEKLFRDVSHVLGVFGDAIRCMFSSRFDSHGASDVHFEIT